MIDSVLIIIGKIYVSYVIYNVITFVAGRISIHYIRNIKRCEKVVKVNDVMPATATNLEFNDIGDLVKVQSAKPITKVQRG